MFWLTECSFSVCVHSFTFSRLILSSLPGSSGHPGFTQMPPVCVCVCVCTYCMFYSVSAVVLHVYISLHSRDVLSCFTLKITHVSDISRSAKLDFYVSLFNSISSRICSESWTSGRLQQLHTNKWSWMHHSVGSKPHWRIRLNCSDSPGHKVSVLNDAERWESQTGRSECVYMRRINSVWALCDIFSQTQSPPSTWGPPQSFSSSVAAGRSRESRAVTIMFALSFNLICTDDMWR